MTFDSESSFSESLSRSSELIEQDTHSKESSQTSETEFLKKNLASRLSKLEYKIWLSDLRIKLIDNKIILHTSSNFKKENISKRYWNLICELASDYFPGLTIDWDSEKLTEGMSNLTPISPNLEDQASDEITSQNSNIDKDKCVFLSPPRQILPENSWENFLEIPENKLARRFISQALDRPGVINPIYLYGFVGVGKTHLLHAFAQSYREKIPFSRVEYITPDDFVSDFTRSLKNKTDRNFRVYYRSLDALLIDDIQFFMGKEKSSQEFFHVFNAIHASGKQMIFTSDRDPRALDYLDDRLKSRIASSAIIEIKTPEVESRKKLIDFYVSREGLNMSEEIRIFLSKNLPSDIRQLVGSIRYLSALCSFQDTPFELTLDFCQKYLKQLQVRPLEKKYPPEKILYAICEPSGFTIKDLKTRKKSKRISHCRQMAMYLLRRFTNLSLPEIGFALGGRSVSSVTYGIEKTKKELSGPQGEFLQKEIERIMDKSFSTSVF